MGCTMLWPRTGFSATTGLLACWTTKTHSSTSRQICLSRWPHSARRTTRNATRQQPQTLHWRMKRSRSCSRLQTSPRHAAPLQAAQRKKLGPSTESTAACFQKRCETTSLVKTWAQTSSTTLRSVCRTDLSTRETHPGLLSQAHPRESRKLHLAQAPCVRTSMAGKRRPSTKTRPRKPLTATVAALVEAMVHHKLFDSDSTHRELQDANRQQRAQCP